jgi:hypothetical protein
METQKEYNGDSCRRGEQSFAMTVCSERGVTKDRYTVTAATLRRLQAQLTKSRHGRRDEE